MNTSSRSQTLKRGKKVVLSERVLRLIIEGKVKVIQGKRLKFGKYKIRRRSRGGDNGSKS